MDSELGRGQVGRIQRRTPVKNSWIRHWLGREGKLVSDRISSVSPCTDTRGNSSMLHHQAAAHSTARGGGGTIRKYHM